MNENDLLSFYQARWPQERIYPSFFPPAQYKKGSGPFFPSFLVLPPPPSFPSHSDDARFCPYSPLFVGHGAGVSRARCRSPADFFLPFFFPPRPMQRQSLEGGGFFPFPFFRHYRTAVRVQSGAEFLFFPFFFSVFGGTRATGTSGTYPLFFFFSPLSSCSWIGQPHRVLPPLFFLFFFF